MPTKNTISKVGRSCVLFLSCATLAAAFTGASLPRVKMTPFSPLNKATAHTVLFAGGDMNDESTVGNRGEAFLAAQGILLASILIGRFPFGDSIAALGGGLDAFLPGQNTIGAITVGSSVISSGLYIMYLSAKELGGSLSHWAVPVEKSEGGEGLVIATGVYGIVRHPMYAGLLSMMTGLGIATHSVLRLALTMALFLVLEAKATHEEEKLAETYPGEYDEYKKKVKGKILPMSLL